MKGSGERCSWTTNTSSPSQELGQQTQAHGQIIFLPSFKGRFNPAIYLAWEHEVEQVFSHHDFSELERVRAATRAFTGFASVRWSLHFKKTIDNQPTTWKVLKVVMRQQFFPPYYRRELLRKCEQFNKAIKLFMLTTKSSNLICIIVT